MREAREAALLLRTEDRDRDCPPPRPPTVVVDSRAAHIRPRHRPVTVVVDISICELVFAPKNERRLRVDRPPPPPVKRIP